MSLTNNFVEYENSDNITNEIYIYEKNEEMSLVISEYFKDEIIITKPTFNVEVKKLDKLIGIENRDIFIFHIEIFVAIEYIKKSLDTNVKLFEKRILTSKLVKIEPSNSNNKDLCGSAFVSYGVINKVNNILYSTFVVCLRLGGLLC